MRLQVLTWNIHKGIGMDRKFRPDRICEVILHHQPDIVLLQEVDRGVPRSRRLHLDKVIAETADYPYSAWAGNHVLREGSYGNATLSRFSLRRKSNLDLTIGKRKRRGCLYTRIRLPKQFKDLHVFNWHLGLSAQERRQQVSSFLTQGTVENLNKNARVLIGGDTNDWRNLLFHSAGLSEAGFHSWSEGGRRRHIATYPSVAPLGALDKFFWRGPFYHPRVHSSRLQLAKTASDHLPLLVEFDLKP